MSRIGRLALVAWLLVFGVVSYATVLVGSIGTIGARGLPAMLELIAHGAIAALAAAAIAALLSESPAAARLGTMTVVLVAAATIQSLFVSCLPRQTSPGQAVPTAVGHAAVAVVWLAWLRRRARFSR
jgi:hypothetical protein